MSVVAADIVGKQFGLLTVASAVSRTAYKCFCYCGGDTVVLKRSLTSGNTKSCGCLRRTAMLRARQEKPEYRQQRVRGTATYAVWQGLKARCTNPSHKAFALYGGRGVSVCDRWLAPDGFKNFLADMGAQPAGMTLDRIDVERGYSPDNCRWADWATQARNKRSSQWVEFGGKHMVVTDWATHLGIPRATLVYRLRAWGTERALTSIPTVRRAS